MAYAGGQQGMQRKAGARPGGSGGDAGSTTFEVPTSPAVKAATLVAMVFALAGVCVLLFMGRGQIIQAVAGASALISRTSVSLPGSGQAAPLTATTQAAGLAARKQAPKGSGGKDKKAGSPAKITRPKKPPSDGKVRVITEITLSNGSKMQILDEPIPDDCFAEEHLDLDGFAVKWGLGNKARSAAECCRQCKEFVPPHAEVPSRCNVWVWCGDPSGVCWTMDVHNHTTGDCWLKHQSGWDGIPDRTKSNLKVNHEARFSDAFRSEHKTAPEWIPWTAGVVVGQAGAKVVAGAAAGANAKPAV